MSDYENDTNEDDSDPEEIEEFFDEDTEFDESDSDEWDENSEENENESDEDDDHPKEYQGWVSGSSLGDQKPDITELDINEIKSCGRFSPEQRAAEYRRRGKSPSGVIDGEYNDEYRGNDEYNDEYRDWDANA